MNDAEAPPPGRITRPEPPAGWRRWLPGAATLRDYQRGWLRHDLQAGLVLTAVLVPVGVAYAVASGVPAIAGLYATIAALLAYALFGPSRVLVLGPDSSLVPLVLGVVLPLAAGDPQRALALAGMIALVSGALCVIAGIARLGFVTELLSKPIRHGYMNGIALTVLISQLPVLFGISVNAQDLLGTVSAFVQAVVAGQANAASLALGTGCLLLILLLKRLPRWPGVLTAVVLATVAVGVFDLARVAGVAVLGALPQGLPQGWPGAAWGTLRVDDLVPVLLGGLAVALVSFADTSVLARTYAGKTGQPASANQEMVGLGVANIAAGLFQGLPVSASSSRTPVAMAAGARTQLAAIVGAIAVAALVVFGPGLLADLPRTALAAVVIASAIALIEVRDLLRIRRMQAWEFWLSLACTVGVVALGPIPGIGLAIVIAVIEFLWGAWRPHHAVLGRVDRIKGYHDIGRYPNARRVPGLVLFRWDAPLFFANAEEFHERVLDAVAASPTPVRWVVVGAEPMTNVDVTAADVLEDLDARLAAAAITLCFAEMKDPVKDKLKRFGLFHRLGGERFFPTLGESVTAYLARYPVDWVDWEDVTASGP